MRLAPFSRAVAATGILITAGMPRMADAGDAVGIVTTPGSGTLTMCRDWLVYNACTKYSKVPLPDRIAVGDKVKLTFGSNPKSYTFPVARIRQQGGDCTILSAESAATGNGEKIEIARCEATTAPEPTAR